MKKGKLTAYTIYDHPSDFPNSFVVRRFVVRGPDPEPDALPYAVGPTLAAVRRRLPPGLYRLRRSAADEPQIVETWI